MRPSYFALIATLLNSSPIFAADIYELWNSKTELHNVWDLAISPSNHLNFVSTNWKPGRGTLVSYKALVADFVTPAETGAFTTVAVGDTNGNGLEEIWGSPVSAKNEIVGYENGLELTRFKIRPGAKHTIGRLELVDMNGDGRDDILVSVGGQEGSSVLLYQYQSRYELIAQYDTVSHVSGFSLINNDQDESPELFLHFVALSGTSLKLRTLDWNGTGFTHTLVETNQVGIANCASSSDLDQNGSQELVIGVNSPDGGALFVYNSQLELLFADEDLSDAIISCATGAFFEGLNPTIATGGYRGELAMWQMSNGALKRLYHSQTLLRNTLRRMHIRNNWLYIARQDGNQDGAVHIFAETPR